jgi:hypothetical protein
MANGGSLRRAGVPDTESKVAFGANSVARSWSGEWLVRGVEQTPTGYTVGYRNAPITVVLANGV